MKILFCNMFSTINGSTIQKFLKKLGHTTIERNYHIPSNLYNDEEFDSMIDREIKEYSPDLVFSINFWPPLARACNKKGLKYISYGYDSPQNLPCADDMNYETNYIFMFDRTEVEEYQQKGVERVFHFTLATDVSHWDSFKNISGQPFDITLVGRLYESTFPILKSGLDDYMQGYINAIIKAQREIIGYNMLEEVLDDERITLANKSWGATDEDGYYIGRRQLFVLLSGYITHMDRISLLRLLQGAGEVHLVIDKISEDMKKILSGVTFHGQASYLEEMPVMFKKSKINLNPVLRAIRSGIPQRALDIMGCNSFLLSAWQPELAEFFIEDEEVVMYHSYEDALEKAKFYLKNDDIRRSIALNAYEKVKKEFTYENRISMMLKMIM